MSSKSWAQPDTNTFIYGPNLHKNLVSRWQKAVAARLSEEDKKELCKYPPPENFQYMAAPKLNPMVVKAISPSKGHSVDGSTGKIKILHKRTKVTDTDPNFNN
ncbi:unnamed protein product [Acanthoscelides obtectus]|uniref:Uncharacterized protein n=1 Tax=Acanthoscelides obtectus TaxID=200917 RepID=A0A9P0MF06_ACAOB|nr:unnamed protein product [Acanthoscelides obtectus]CAK1659564.1 hypothetical protein AOBTE_LOCUS21540 [Acanthoscelides obtectus]